MDYLSAQYKHDFSRPVTVDFIGVFETVVSVGTMLPRTLPLPATNHMVRTFRHALALDEHRASFQAKLWVRGAPPDEKGLNEDFGPGVTTGAGKKLGQLERRVLDGVDDVPKEKNKKGTDDPSGDTSNTKHERPIFKGTDVKEVWFPGCHTGEPLLTPSI